MSVWCLWVIGGGGDGGESEIVTTPHILLELCIDTHLEQV